MTTPPPNTSLIKFFYGCNKCANNYIWRIWNNHNYLICEDYRDEPTDSKLNDREVVFYNVVTKPANNLYPFEEMQTIINVYVGGNV